MLKSLINFTVIPLTILIIGLGSLSGQALWEKEIESWKEGPLEIYDGDWLLYEDHVQVQVVRSGLHDIILSNGLVSRRFALSPNTACSSIKNLITEEEYVRSIQPEAQVTIDGVQFNVGGLIGAPEYGYLKEDWIEEMQVGPRDFLLVDIEKKYWKNNLQWRKNRWVPSFLEEQSGMELVFSYQSDFEPVQDVVVEVHYLMYHNLPLMTKWIEVQNKGSRPIVLDHFVSELIAHPESINYVDIPDVWPRPNFHLQNDYTFGGFTYEESDQAIQWEIDSNYTSQVNWQRQTPVLMKSSPKIGPAQKLDSGDQFVSFKTHFLAFDGTDRERNTLSKRRLYRFLAPWVTENPIFMHLVSTDEQEVKEAIDQCVEVGYEMVILSFGSGLNMEDLSQENISKFQRMVDYAHSKNIELGGYSLFSSRRIHDTVDVIDKDTGRPGGAKFGHAPCLASAWGMNYLERISEFIRQTNFDILEHDGPYPGDFCGSQSHAHHHGYEDSQWVQWRLSTEFYQDLLRRGVYMNVPDNYMLNGTNKVGIGYREVNWSLPRAQQIILGRQNIYDGTWLRTPSMGWTFVPLTEYHGGGEAATLEPLSEHLESYEAHMIQNYGSGVQACYRGKRLYDTPETKALVKQRIDFYKKYREILNADIIHLRRPDGRDWDGMMHADPRLNNKGFAMFYNPTGRDISRTVTLPLYYTGLKNSATIVYPDGIEVVKTMDSFYKIKVDIDIPANHYTYLIIR